MPAPKFRMRGITSASETEATQKKTSTAPKFRMRGAGGGTSPSLPTATSQTAGETTGKKKAGRPTAGGKLSKITSPEREAESRAEELRTLRDEAHQEFLNFRGAEITAGATGMPTEPYAGQRYRTAEEAYQAWQDYDRQYAEFRNQYYQEENERQQARLAGDTAMQASFARADEIRGALNRIQSLEQTRAAAPGPMTEDAVSQTLQELVGQYGLSQEDGRDLTTARKALEAQLLDETDRLSAAGYDYERMTEYRRRQQTAAEAEQQRQQTEAWADEHPVLASIASVGASALQAVDIPRLIATGGGSEDDLRTYTPADPNAAIISNFVTGVRDTVSKKIEENTDWELFGQNMASFLYNTGMSIGDSASQVALLGPWATYLMGASAASQQAVNVLERGGSNSQAFWGGLAAGAAEAVFERFSIEKLLEAKTINSVKDLLRATAQQAGTEASEEMLTEIANILSDTAIMGESSDFEQLVTQYQLMGMDEDEARKQAYLDSVAQVVWAGVGGALSGMAMGGGLGGMDLAGRNIRQGIRDYQARPADSAYDVMREKGMFSPEAREAVQAAERRRGVTEAVDRAAWMSDRWNRKVRRDYLKNRGSARGEQELPTASQQAQSPQATQAAPAGTQNAAPEGAAQEGTVQVGLVTTIQRPYQGTVPVQAQGSTAALTVSGESIHAAADRIQQAQNRKNNGQGFKSALKNIYKSVFQPARGVPVTGMTYEGQPYTVDINSNVPGKVISDPNLTAEKLALLDMLPEVVRNGTYVGSGEYVQHGRKQAAAIRYDYFETPVIINGQNFIAKFDVEVLPMANNYRTHQIIKIDLTPDGAKHPGPTPGLSRTASSPVEGTRPLNSDSTIAPGAENVNTQGRTRLRPAPINYDMAEEGARVVRVLKERYGSSPTLEDIRNFDWSRGSEFYPKVAEAIRAGFVKAGKKKGGLYVVRETRPQTQAAENTDQQPVTAEMDGPIDRAADGGVQSEQETEERTVNSYGRQGAAEGGRVSDGDLGRLSGTGAGEQAGGVGTGAERGRGPTDTFRAARERQNSVHDLRGGPVSSRDLGLRRGTDAKTLQVIPESAWDDGLRATADRVREETGLDTVFVTGGIQIGTPDGARLVRGAYTGDRIIVQADNIRVTPDQIADHEIFHDRAAQTPGLILELETRIREQYGAEELDRVVDRYIQKLRGVIDVTENTGEDGTPAEAWAILEEIFADAYAGINAFSAHAEQFNETVEQTMTERGVGRGSQNAAATDRTTGPPAEGRYSFGGENAQRADLEALDRAQDMERRGVAMETIFRETGWYTGADGKWRFEIDDSGMEYDPSGDLQGAVSRQWAMEDLEAAREDLFGSITKEQADMVRAYNRAEIAGDTAEQQRLYDELTSTEFGFLFETYADALERANAAKNNPQGGTLADYINHPELFANYPQLRQAGLQFADLSDGTRGRYNTESHTITLDNSLRDAPEDTLVHEIQHAIQSAEGFSGGSSPEYWARREYEMGDLVTNRLQQEYDQILNGLGREDQNKYIRYTELERELERLFLSDPNTEAGRRYDRLEAEQDAIYEELYPNAWFRQLLDLSRRMEDTAGEYRRMYENTAGEIEARDVTARRQLTPEQRRRTMPNTGDENTVFAESGDSYSMQEPDAAAQDEAERLLFQGVDADTIRELTGLERTEDGDWRFAVDTAPAAAYDGGRTIDQQGGLDDGQNEYDAQGVLGETARREAERAESFAGTSGADATETRRTDRQAHDGRADTGTHPRWARGHLIDQPSPAAGIAAENAGRYGADAFVVDDAAIKERNPNAWALTSGGKVYISNRIPADLADVVGFHEAVHAAKQNESPNYRAFIENTLGYISKESAETTRILDLLSSTRFGGKAFTELSDREVQTALDELNALVWGFHKADPENARAQFADMFQDYDAYIADLDAAMESGAEPEIPGLSLPTLDDEDIRYSVDEDTAAEPSDNPLPSPDQSGRSDLHRPRGMSDEQYNRLNEQWKSRPAAQRAEPGAVPEGFDSIDDYTAALEAAAEERMRNRSREEFEGSDALKSLGIRIANSVGLYGNTQQLIENDRAAKSVRKEIKRAERRLQATDAEKNFASGVAAGIYGEADIPPSMDADTVMELADYYWAEKAVQNDLIREQRTKINRNLDERVRRLMDGVDDTKTKVPAAVIMRNRTPERNMRRIFGNAKGDEINDYLFRPVQDNEAERIRFVNRMHNEVRTFLDRDGKNRGLNQEERALVQLVIEGRAAEDAVNAMERSRDIQNAAENIKNARKLAGKDDLAKRRQAEIDASVDEAREFNLGTDERRLAIQYSRWLETQERLQGADTTIIGNAVEKYRELFNQLYDAANDFLVAHGYEPIGFIRGYAPHLQSQETQERFNNALERMGINREIGKLPTSIAGRTKNFKPNMPWNGFFKNRNSQGEFLDPDIAEGFEKYVDSMSDVLYHTDDIMRTRAFVRYFRRTYAPEEIRNQLEQADALRYAQADQQASFLRDKRKLSYTSAPTYEDVHQAMEQYVEDQYQAIENLTLYGDLAVFLDDYANNLANKQLFEDRAMEKSFGRTSLNAISKAHRAFARAQVSANLSSALNQGGQLPIILAENGTRNVAQALIELRSKDLKSWAAGSDFLTEKKGINYIVTSWKDRAITGAFKPLEIVDGIVSTLAVRSRYLKEVRAGKSAAEAMRLADRFGREVMASRAKGSVPLAFRSKDFLNQMVHMFQLEALNNWEHVIQDLGNRDFREMARAKGKRAAAGSLAAVLVKIILGAFLLNRIDEELYGGTPAPFDVLGLAGNVFAGGLGLTQMDLLRTLADNGWERLTGERLFDTDPELNEFDAAAAFDDFVWNGLNEIPFASNVAALAGMGDRTLPMPDLSNLADLPGTIAEDGLFSWEVARQLAGLAGDVLPGGRQIEKSIQGGEALLRGGYYRGSGENRRLQFPVEQDFWSIVRGTLFGRSALDESRDFYASGQTGLSANQTKAYEQIVDMGADPETVYQAIQRWRTAENDEDLNSYGRGVAKRDAITEADLTDEQKLALYRGLSDADSSTPDHFRAMMDTGLSWEEVMEAYDQYQFLNSDEDTPEAERLSASEKATEFASWVERQNYTEDQAETVKEALRYWQMIPAEASEKILLAQEYGVSDSSRKAAAEEIDRLKGDGNSVTQDMAAEALENMPGLDNRERAILWQLQNKSWKWNKNPFDKRVGREVYDRMHEEDEA